MRFLPLPFKDQKRVLKTLRPTKSPNGVDCTGTLGEVVSLTFGLLDSSGNIPVIAKGMHTSVDSSPHLRVLNVDILGTGTLFSLHTFVWIPIWFFWGSILTLCGH